MTEQPPSTESTQHQRSFEEMIREEKASVEKLLKARTAYELLPESGKVVVIDVGVSISSAFQALAENGLLFSTGGLFEMFILLQTRYNCSTPLG